MNDGCYLYIRLGIIRSRRKKSDPVSAFVANGRSGVSDSRVAPAAKTEEFRANVVAVRWSCLRYKIYVGAGNVSRENDASKDGNVVVFHIRMRVFLTRRLSLVRVEFFAVGKQKNEQAALDGAVLERALTAAYRFVPVREGNAGG